MVSAGLSVCATIVGDMRMPLRSLKPIRTFHLSQNRPGGNTNLGTGIIDACLSFHPDVGFRKRGREEEKPVTDAGMSWRSGAVARLPFYRSVSRSEALP